MRSDRACLREDYSMNIAVPQETAAGERRVALVPAATATLIKSGHEVRVEHDAGLVSGFLDAHYSDRGATIVQDRGQLISGAQVVARVRVGSEDVNLMNPGQILIGFADPLTSPDSIKAIAARGV